MTPEEARTEAIEGLVDLIMIGMEAGDRQPEQSAQTPAGKPTKPKRMKKPNTVNQPPTRDV